MTPQATQGRSVVLVGAGNVATHLGRALQETGCEVRAVYSRSEASARVLAAELGTRLMTDLADLPDADLFLLSVKDDALPGVAAQLCPRHPGSLFAHTAGSVPMSLFGGLARRYGVIYPLQTFSRQRRMDISFVPLFVEASDAAALAALTDLARSLSRYVVEMDSATRRQMHLSAVFVCNFVNHLYALGEQIMDRCGLPFDLLLPLIDETARKVHELSPRRAQTGPAVRGDKAVMDAQTAMIGDPDMRELYRMMCKSIEKISRQ